MRKGVHEFIRRLEAAGLTVESTSDTSAPSAMASRWQADLSTKGVREMSKLIEIEETRKMSREEAAGLLRRLADMLARHNDLEFTREGTRFTVAVADEVEVEFEIEIESDESSIEVELSW